MFFTTIDYSNSSAGGSYQYNVFVGHYMTRTDFMPSGVSEREIDRTITMAYWDEENQRYESDVDTLTISGWEFSVVDDFASVENFSALFPNSISAGAGYRIGDGIFFSRGGYVELISVTGHEPSVLDTDGRSFGTYSALSAEEDSLEEAKDEFIASLGSQTVQFVDAVQSNGAVARYTFSESLTLEQLGYGVDEGPFTGNDEGYLSFNPDSVIETDDPFGSGYNPLRVIGSRFDDGIGGSVENDTLLGGDGNDLLGGFWGDDLVDGGNGNDTLTDDLGEDTLIGGAGDDLFRVYFEDAVVIRDEGRTRLLDNVIGGSGNDTLSVIDILSVYESYSIRGTPDNFTITYANQYDLTATGIENVTFSVWDDEVIHFSLTTEELFETANTQGLVRTVSGGSNAIYLPGDGQGTPDSDFNIISPGEDSYDGGAGDDIIVIQCPEEGTPPLDMIAVDAGAGDDLVYAFEASGHGSNASLHIIGGLGDDDISGCEGDDFLEGGSGRDRLNGLAGNDHLYGDEFAVAFSGHVSNQVYRLYQATLGREPDAGGHANWAQRLFEGELTLPQAAAGFVGSREFQNVYGSLSNTDFVTLLYNNVLDRAPDSGGLASWSGQLNGGTSTRAEVVVGFSESQELINNTNAAAYQAGLAATDQVWSDEVYRLYQATLDRAPDIGGFLSWTEQLGDGRDFLEVVSGFVGSAEFQNTYRSLSNTDFVTLLYSNVLNRAPDAGGLASWTGHLDGATLTRSEVVRGFSNSQEFINNTTPDLKAWMLDQGTQDVLDGGSGTNVMMGGILSDMFVFDSADGASSNTVMDLEAWDRLSFESFSYATAADALAKMTQQGADVLFSDQGVEVTLKNTTLGSVTDDMFFV